MAKRIFTQENYIVVDRDDTTPLEYFSKGLCYVRVTETNYQLYGGDVGQSGYATFVIADAGTWFSQDGTTPYTATTLLNFLLANTGAESVTQPLDIGTFGGGTPTVGTFGQLITAFEVRDIAVKWEYGVYETNYDMLPPVTTGDGTQSFDVNMLAASSATTGTVKLRSKKVTRYRTGNGGFAWFTALLDSSTGVCYAGLESDNGDKVVIRENNGVIEFGYSRAGTGDVTYVPSTSFNGDADVASIVWSNLNIFRIHYGYLGTADLELYIRQNGKTVLLHKMVLAGNLTTTHVRYPQFRMSIYAENGATVKTASWAAGTYSNVLEQRGQDPSARPLFHKTERNLSPTTSDAPIVAFRSKAQYNSVNHSVISKLLLASIATTSEGLYSFNFILNPTTITGGTFVDINTLSSVIEVNEGVTAYTGGNESFTINVSVASAGTNSNVSQVDFEKLGVFLNAGESFVLTIKEISGGQGSDDHVVSFSWQELF